MPLNSLVIYWNLRSLVQRRDTRSVLGGRSRSGKKSIVDYEYPINRRTLIDIRLLSFYDVFLVGIERVRVSSYTAGRRGSGYRGIKEFISVSDCDAHGCQGWLTTSRDLSRDRGVLASAPISTSGLHAPLCILPLLLFSQES